MPPRRHASSQNSQAKSILEVMVKDNPRIVGVAPLTT